MPRSQSMLGSLSHARTNISQWGPSPMSGQAMFRCKASLEREMSLILLFLPTPLLQVQAQALVSCQDSSAPGDAAHREGNAHSPF